MHEIMGKKNYIANKNYTYKLEPKKKHIKK